MLETIKLKILKGKKEEKQHFPRRKQYSVYLFGKAYIQKNKISEVSLKNLTQNKE